MALFSSDAFDGADGTGLTAYNAAWVQHPAATDIAVITDVGRARGSTTGNAVYYHSGSPISADYVVSADLVFKEANGGAGYTGVIGRADTVAQTFYMFRYGGGTVDEWQIHKCVGGTFTLLGSVDQTIADESIIPIQLEMIGSQISGYINGSTTPIITVTDAEITAVGKAGIRLSSTSATNTTHIHLDNFAAEDYAIAVPQGVVTVSTVSAGGASATVAYSYNNIDQSGFEYRINGGAWVVSGASPIKISGLTAQTPYNTPGIEMRATNTAGGGAPSLPVAFTTLGAEYNVAPGNYMGGPNHNVLYRNGVLYYSTFRISNGNTVVYRLEGSVTTEMVVAAFSYEVHNNASFAMDSNNILWCVYCHHGIGVDVRVRKAATPYAIDFGAEQLVSNGTEIVRYPRLILTADGVMWLFYNSGNSRSIVYKTSTDSGATWSGATVLFMGTAPYFGVDVFDNEIVVVTSNGHADDMAAGTSRGYFLRWNGTAWTDAANIAYTLPTDGSNAQSCYNPVIDTRNFGFSPSILKTASGWFVSIGARNSSNAVYRLVWAGTAWSQEAILTEAQGASDGATVAESEWSILATVDDSAGLQLSRISSPDNGATWVVEHLTGSTLTLERGSVRRIYGWPSTPAVMYHDMMRDIYTNEVTADTYALFNTVTSPSTVSSDLADGYALRANVASDYGDSYTIDSASTVFSDFADAYEIRAAVSGDLADSYALRASVSGDFGDAYALRSNIDSDLVDSYDIASASSVASDFGDGYLVRATVSGDLGDSYALRSVVAGDLEDAYLLRAGVAAEFVDLYSLRGFVSSDLADAYLSAGVVSSDLADSYAIQSEIAPTVLSAARRTYSNTQSAQRSNTQSARRPR